MLAIILVTISTVGFSTAIAMAWDICRKAEADHARNCASIIDRMNRFVVSPSDRAARRFVEGR